MAQHLDLEEQEQLDQLKHFWAKYGNAITWLLVLVLGGFAAWNGWQYWQRKTAVEAAALYEELDRAVQASQTERVQRVWADLQGNAGRSAQAAQGGLLAAKACTTRARPTTPAPRCVLWWSKPPTRPPWPWRVCAWPGWSCKPKTRPRP